ncbi:alanine racemase [Agrobacterium rosae]|uniref:alanine racemase n=1 Tax=Agrobacterium rosae TaxID=1972867 RepID=UPI003A7FC83B
MEHLPPSTRRAQFTPEVECFGPQHAKISPQIDATGLVSPYQPVLDQRIADLLTRSGTLASWIDCFGSPLHLIFPEIAFENASRWRNSLDATYSNIDVRFGMKACKSHALATAFRLANLGMDVSSSEELIAAMSALVTRERVSFTGPDKPDQDLAMCVAHGVAVNIDSLCELDRLAEIQRFMGVQGKAVLRLLPSVQTDSRFGLAADDLLTAAIRLKEHGIQLEGLSFHLSGYDSDQRVKTAGEALIIAQELASRGSAIQSLCIGGGFTLSYLAREPRPDAADDMRTWQNRDRPSNYPYYSTVSGEHHATQIIGDILANLTNREIINEMQLKLVLEPGRALTDQCGGTLFRVTGTKQTHDGLNLIILDGMSFSLAENWFGSDFMPLPLHIPLSPREEQKRSASVLVGRSCLECDVVRWRVVDFASLPQTGDLIFLHNTAGYQMDMNESNFHQIPLPRKLGVFFNKDQPTCQLDAEVNIRSFMKS